MSQRQSETSARPPRLARTLIRLRIPSPDQIFILRDLDDRFGELCRSGSAAQARRWYWRQALLTLTRISRWPTEGSARAADARGRLVGIRTDLRAAMRSFMKRPIQAAFTVVTLALGIGLTATAFSILYGTVLRGLPFEDAEQLVHFERSNLAENQPSLPVTPHDYVDWRARQRSFEDLGAYVEAIALIPNDGAPPSRYTGVFISANSFPLLRVDPARGRGFVLEDERIGSPPVVLLSHALWITRFGGDPNILGRDVPVNGSMTTVVGIMPEGFGFPIAEQFWLPLRLDLSVTRGDGRLDVFGRLGPGIEIEAARAEFLQIAAQLQQAHPTSNQNVEAVLRDFTTEYVGPEFIETVYRMLAGAGLLLLLCCTNVMHLLLGHAFRRRSDLAVRTALGASRGHLVRQVLIEAGVLASAGAAGALLVVMIGTRWFNEAGAQAGALALPHGPSSLFWWDVGVDGTAFSSIAFLAILTTLGSGLVPALRGAREGIATTLRDDHRASSNRAFGRFTQRLVVVEIALSTALLVAAGFVVKSVLRVESADEGFDGNGVIVTRVDLPVRALGTSEGRYAEVSAQAAFAGGLLARLEGDPAVEAAAIMTQAPLIPPSSAPFEVDGGPGFDIDSPPTAGVVTVTPDYFRLFGVPPLQGRGLESGDREGTLPVAVVNQTFSTRYLGEVNPIGARIRLGDPNQGDPWLTVVGVVPDLWNRPQNPLQNAGVYTPIAQANTPDPSVRTGRWGLRFQTLAVKVRGVDEGLPGRIRDAVFAEDPSLPVGAFRPMSEVVSARMGRYSVWGRFYLVFAGAGLFLAAIGVYGVLAFEVESRTSDIGIRRALGASAGSVQREVVASAFAQILIGSAVGLVLGFWGSRGLSQVLYDVRPDDPKVFIGVVALLVGVGLVASWIPARRAAAVHPAQAVRAR